MVPDNGDTSILILSDFFRAQPGVGMESEDSGGGTGDTSTYQVQLMAHFC